MIFGLFAAATTRNYLRSSNPAIWDNSGSLGRRSVAGKNITPRNAMALGAYGACVRVLGEDTAKLPLFCYKRLDEYRRERATKRKEYKLLHARANNSATAMTVREHLVRDAASWGNGVGEIQRDGYGDPYAIHSLRADRCQPFFDGAGDLRWKYKSDDMRWREIPKEDTIHVCGPSDNGVIGWPMAYYASECIGTGLAQQEYAGAFYGNGGKPQVVLTHPNRLKEEGRDRLISDWKRLHGGSANASGTAVLEEGMDVKELTVHPRDAEIIKSREYTDIDVCGWFRMPLAKIQRHRQAKGWSTTEAESISYVRDTLLAWLIRVEQAFNAAFFPNDDSHYVEHLVDALLRADSQGRATYHNKMWQSGAMTQNEIRRQENMDPIGPEGDEFWVPQNMIPMKKALAKPEPTPQPQLAPPPKDDDDDNDDDDQQARWLTHAAARVLRKETKAVVRIAERFATDEPRRLDELVKLFASLAGDLADAFSPATEQPDDVATLCTGIAQAGLEEYQQSDDYTATAAARASTCPGVWAAQVQGVVSALRKANQ